MINVKGLVKTRAASLSNPGGKLSSPDAFLRLRFLCSFKISDSLTALKVNWFSVTWLGRCSSTGLLQTKSRSKIDFLFRFLAMVLKYSQKLLAWEFSFWPAHAHLNLTCACASHFDLRTRISFWPEQAHIILTCARASHFDLRTRMTFWPEHAHFILTCARASHFDLRLRISFWPAHTHLILTCAYAWHFDLCLRI